MVVELILLAVGKSTDTELPLDHCARRSRFFRLVIITGQTWSS